MHVGMRLTLSTYQRSWIQLKLVYVQVANLAVHLTFPLNPSLVPIAGTLLLQYPKFEINSCNHKIYARCECSC